MKIICNKETFNNSLNIVSKFASTKTNLPILETVLFQASNNLKLLANDLEMGIEYVCDDVEILETGAIAINARMLCEIIRKMPGDEIKLETTDDCIVILSSEKTEFKILGINGDEFPTLPFVEKEKGYSINSDNFRNLIRRTIFSVSTDDYRPILSGELLHIKDGKISMVAVDGFRISYRCADIDSADEEVKVVVPAKALTELSKIIDPEQQEEFKFYFTENNILFEFENYIVTSRLLEGEFLNYHQIFNSDFGTKIKINKEIFIDSLERSMLLTKSLKPVKLQIMEHIMQITTTTETGTSFDEIEVELEGESLTVAYNPRYLLDALKAIDEEEVFITYTTQLSPCIIKSEENSDFKYLVLPLRVKKD